jgi:Protein of unknown function DUF262
VPQTDKNFQNVAWFRDLHTRELLEMEPPFQRRSVWPQRFREDFVDTILLGYPSPPIFLFERLNEQEQAEYAVVDGKQRLLTIFSFMNNVFPVGNRSPLERLRGVYYESLDETRKDFLRYRLSVEYVPSDNEGEINNIFDRFNRNVKKLTPQELRHAKLDGIFITAAEDLAEWMRDKLGATFPKIADMSRRQMKDVEFVATLLLFLEEGIKSYSTAALDDAFAKRDEDWEFSPKVQNEFRDTITILHEIVDAPEGRLIPTTRLRNQADFYSLFAAVTELQREKTLPNRNDAAARLTRFAEQCDIETPPLRITAYLEAARAASNDYGSRKTRILAIRDALLDNSLSDNNGSK